ncbi:6-phosphogluconolactonase [Kaarinaea lacus]
MANISVAENSQELFRRVADYWQQIAQTAQHEHGKFHVALAGGSTPRGLYQLLASDAVAKKLDWQHTNFYFGDERAVPLDHEQSNFHMAHEAMLDTLAIPATNVFPLITDLDHLENSARHYEKILHRELPLSKENLPMFDLILLGLGDDGHTASLFPDTSILNEQSHLVAKVYVEKLQSWRLSFTYPLINRARHVAFLVTGKAKAEKIKQVLVDKPGTNPAEGIQPQGELTWFLDADAASMLPENYNPTL